MGSTSSRVLPPILGISNREAAQILGMHENTVARYVARGLLRRHSPGRIRYPLDRDEVEQLALERWTPGQPYWLRTAEAAEVLGVSTARVRQLARAGRLPFVERDGLRHFRRLQLEVVANAREALLG